MGMLPGDPMVSSDCITALLRSLEVSGSLFARMELRAPWGLDVIELPRPVFHIVGAGEGTIELDGAPPQALAVGDIVVLPRGAAHVLRDDARSEPVPLADVVGEVAPDRCARVHHGGSGARTVLVCGAFEVGDAEIHPVMRAMPKLVHVRAGDIDAAWLSGLLQLVELESREDRPGTPAVVDRLAGALFLQVLRAYLLAGPADAPPWVRGVRDSRLAPALTAIYTDPGTAWTVDALGARCGMSRSVFAARFSETMGETPMKYVTRWRMWRAAYLLQHEALTVAEVSEQIGYQSETTFSRAFKAHYGQPPGTYARLCAASP